MTTEQQRRANKLNAARSTGPRTESGKARASNNALKHGLSISIARDPGKTQAITQLAAMLSPGESEHALKAAEACLELVRIREHKAAASSRAEVTERQCKTADFDLAVGRYERRAISKRNRALRSLD
jgi:hypothetical protein